LWDDLFLYCEDLEYSLRAVQAGYRCITVGDSLVHHKISSSAGAKGDDKLSPNKAYYFARNYILTIKRHASGMTLLSGILAQFVVILPLRTLMMAQSGSLSSFSHYLNGLWHGLRGYGGQRQV
jgi:GT2 family glycosyltransferase